MGKPTFVEFDGIDLSGYVADAPAEPESTLAERLAVVRDSLRDASMTITGFWEPMTIVVPPWMLEPRYRKRLALLLDPVGYRRRRRMHAAYRQRRR